METNEMVNNEVIKNAAEVIGEELADNTVDAVKMIPYRKAVGMAVCAGAVGMLSVFATEYAIPWVIRKVHMFKAKRAEVKGDDTEFTEE